MTTKPGFHQTGGCFSSERKGHLFSWCTWMPKNCCSFPYFPPPPRILNGTRLMFVLWTSSSLIPGLTWLHKSNCTLGLQTSGGREGVSLLLFFVFFNCWGERYDPASVVSAILPLWYSSPQHPISHQNLALGKVLVSCQYCDSSFPLWLHSSDVDMYLMRKPTKIYLVIISQLITQKETANQPSSIQIVVNGWYLQL